MLGDVHRCGNARSPMRAESGGRREHRGRRAGEGASRDRRRWCDRVRWRAVGDVAGRVLSAAGAAGPPWGPRSGTPYRSAARSAGGRGVPRSDSGRSRHGDGGRPGGGRPADRYARLGEAGAPPSTNPAMMGHRRSVGGGDLPGERHSARHGVGRISVSVVLPIRTPDLRVMWRSLPPGSGEERFIPQKAADRQGCVPQDGTLRRRRGKSGNETETFLLRDRYPYGSLCIDDYSEGGSRIL